jgi:hypothetical protein
MLPVGAKDASSTLRPRAWVSVQDQESRRVGARAEAEGRGGASDRPVQERAVGVAQAVEFSSEGGSQVMTLLFNEMTEICLFTTNQNAVQ